MATYVKTKHDIGLLRQDGTTTIGLMLAKDKNGNPIYSSYDDEFMAQQLATSQDYANQPPEKELALIRSDWRAGFGQEYDDDAKRYYYTVGSDCRFKGMGILGPVATSISPASTIAFATVTNGDMEANSTWTGGSRSNTYAHKGTYSWKVAGVDGSANTAYQDLTWDASYKGKTFKFFGWYYIAGAPSNHVHITIDDGVDTTSSGNLTAEWAWTKVTLSHTLNANATRIRITMTGDYDSGFTGKDSYFDDFYSYVGGTVNAIADFNSNLYFAIGNGLCKLNPTGDGFTYVNHFYTDITDLKVFGANLYIALGNSYAYNYMNTGETVTESTLSNNTMKYFCTIKATADTLYGSDTVNTIRSTTNPVNGGTAWSTQTTVDSSSYAINELLTRGNVLYIRKADRPFYLDSTGNVKVLVEDTARLANSDAGLKAAVFLDDIYFPWGNQSLLRYSTYDDTMEWLDPSDFCTNLSTFTGKVQAQASDERYLYVVVDNSTKLEIMAGRYEVVDGTNIWTWHPLQEITLTNAQTAYVSSVYKKRLWIGSTTGTDSVYYIPLTTNYGDITNDTNYTFATGGYTVSSWHHLNFKADTKAFIKMTCTTSNCDANVYWTAAYQKLGDSSWTTVGAYNSSPSKTIYIPVDGSANKPKSTMIRFKFTGTTNSSAETPILLSYDVRAILYPTNRNIIQCEVLCDNDITLKDGSREIGQAANIKAAIEEARAATWPVTFYDIDWSGSGDTVYVKFLPTVSSVTTREKTPFKTERHYKLTLQKVALS